MLVANPIYDVVFKYLMEDLEIAKELISLIIKEEITDLEIKPQETTTELFLEGIRIFRLDFKAIIKTKDGKRKKVLIELQKAKELFDIMRFRRYLAENYGKGELLDGVAEKEVEYKALPIIAIYFLGFKLKGITYPVVKVGRKFINVLTGQEIKKPEKDEFFELLTHESYAVQIPYLNKKLQSKLGYVLSAFNQELRIDDKKILDLPTSELDDPLYAKVVHRLFRAIATNDIRRQMDAEEEVERIFKKNMKKLLDSEKKIKESEKKIQESEKKIQESEKKVAASEKKVQDAERKVQESEKKAQESEKKAQESEKKAQESEKKVQESEIKIQASEQKVEAERLAKEKALAELEELKKLIKKG